MIKTTGDIFGRVVTAMVTPFDDNSELDFKAIERVAEHLLKTGTSAIVVAGTTGESPTLDDAEKKELLKAVVKVNAGKAKIIMGTGSNDTRKSIKASQEAEALGADALLIVAPYYNKPNQDGLKAHFSAIARSTKLPIVIYNIPGRTGINVSVETTLALAEEFPNIVALKDSTGSVEQAQDIARLAGQNFRIYSGDDNLTLPFLSVGACGVISVASHLVGNEIKQMIEFFHSGKTDEARAIHLKYLPLFKGLFLAPNPTCLKYAMSKLNLCKENLRLPLAPLAESQRKIVDDLIKEIKSTEAASCI